MIMNKLFVLIFLFSFGCMMKDKYPISDHFDGNAFFNPGLNIDNSFIDLLKWNLNRNRGAWPNWVENTHTANLNLQLNQDEIAVTFINHVTFLIQSKELNVLTDPVFSM